MAKSAAIHASAEVGRAPFVQTIRNARTTFSANAPITVQKKTLASRSIPRRSASV